MPLVSIITPSYNDGHFIEDNILSVKYQDYSEIEHIVVDGGSTDSTLDILGKYENIRWVSEPDNGVTDAINKGIRMASGDILAIQNSDDAYYSRDAVRKAVDAMMSNPTAGVIFGDCVFTDADGKVTQLFKGGGKRFNFPALLCRELTIPLPSAFIRRSAVEAIGGKLNVTFVPDWELWVQVGLKFPIIYVAETFGIFRRYPEQIGASVRFAFESAAQQRIILDRIFHNPQLPPEIRSLRKRAYAGTYANEAYLLLSIGREKKARRYIWKSVRLYPRNFFNLLIISYFLRSFDLGKLVDWAGVLRRRRLKREASLKVNKTIRWWPR